MDKNSASSGISALELLTVVFVVLKLCGVISWSWWWVLSPVWITTAIVLTVLAAAVVKAYLENRKQRR
ncbi:MAG: hypothetical protein PHI27_06650 [Eubacteriales bacterium]|nr:hypothetical protein [Eubacteriales bacterium]MDD4513753.1 hypothetical protein [Eubacteriales bacterium]